MLKKLVVPVFTLAIATFGCSSSTTSNGTGGSGGTSATGGSGGKGGTSATGGTTGTGGTSATGGAAGASATGGAGGHATGGAGGANATGGAGGASATGGAGGASGGAGGVTTTDAGRMADCTVTTQDGTSVLSATTFCTNLIAYCSNVSGFTLPTDYATESACETAYAKNGTTQRDCQSYHLCWGVEGITNTSGAIPKTHCPHASAVALCVAPADAASGN